MKKKKEKVAPQKSTFSAVDAATITDPKSLIHDHALFFDKLIELIPAKFYLSNDEDSKPWFKGLSKAAKASAKQQTKDNIKKARRHRLDPEKPQSSTLDLLKQTIENGKSTNKESDRDEDDDEDEDDNEAAETNRSRTLEKLRQRVNELRGNRGDGKKSKIEKRVKRDYHQEKKRKRINELGDGRDGKFVKSEGELEKEVVEATKGIAFGKVKIGGEEDAGRKKKRKLSKAQELERAKRLEEAKKDPERGEVVAKKLSWSAATSRAAGIKVHDDSKLLKQSIHKEKKRHEKNSQKWKDRVDSREKTKEEKQQKRAGNIAERIQQKKMRKIAKREKKLMRPGFEGRKEGYINEN